MGTHRRRRDGRGNRAVGMSGDPARCRRTRATSAQVLLFTVLLGACENPLAPESCGPIPQQTVHVGESASVPVCFNDDNGDRVSLSAASSDPVVATAEARGSAVTVTAVSPGTATVTVKATDPGGLSGTASFSVMVPNRSPRAAGTIAARTMEVGQTASVDVSASFEEPDGQPLSYRASSSDDSIATVSVSGSTVTVAAVSVGTATVTVTATDPDDASATQTFTVEVEARNRAPRTQGTIADRSVLAGSSVTVDVTNVFTDPDGDALTYLAVSSAMSVATVDVTGSTVTVTGVSVGSAMVTVTARDPEGLEARQSFDVTVTAAGAPDLEFSDVDPAAIRAVPGANITVDFTIRNAGNKTSPASISKVHQSSDGTIDPTDLAISTPIAVDALAPLATTTIPIEFNLPVGAEQGTVFYFGMCVDAVTGEHDTGNNCSDAVTITIWITGYGIVRLTDNSASDGSPAWSPDTTRIAFESNRDVNFEIYVMNADGSGVARRTHSTNHDDTSPAWSPDGRRIAFSSRNSVLTPPTPRSILVMNANGSGATHLHDLGDADNPAWSPDGLRIAFQFAPLVTRDADPEIYLMNADGSGVTQRTDNDDNDSAPAWSPDGLRIAFVSDRDGNNEIYVMNATGTRVTNLTGDDGNDSAPAWSPDGRRIAFVSDRDGNRDIYVMFADGSGVTNLTVNAVDDSSPAWSPDGTRIAFVSDRDGNPEIYVMTLPVFGSAAANRARPLQTALSVRATLRHR